MVSRSMVSWSLGRRRQGALPVPPPVSSAFGLFTHARFGCVGLACWLPCLCTPREAPWARPWLRFRFGSLVPRADQPHMAAIWSPDAAVEG